MKSRPAVRIGLMITSWYQREVLSLGQGYSTKNPEQKRLEVGAIGKEACYVTKEGAVQIRLGGDDANVIFREGWIMGIQH